MNTKGAARGVLAAKAVVQEDLQRDLLLAQHARAAERLFANQIHDGANAGRGGELNGAPVLAKQFLVIHFAGVRELDELAPSPTTHRAKDDDDVLERHRHGAFQHFFELFSMFREAQFVH